MNLNALLAAVDEKRLMAAVEAVCTGERLSNEAEKASFAALEALYKEAGCEVRTEHHLGFVSTPEAASLAVVGGETLPCRTHSMTPSVTDLTAPLLYLPPDALDETEPEAIAGRIVLTDGLAMEPVVRTLEEKGASGVVFITGRFIHNMIVSRTWGSPTPETADHYVKIPAVSITLADGERLKAQLEASPLQVVMTTRVWSRWTEITVLVAEIAHPSGDFVMVTGHNDSWHLGAMDNASGNACAVELARLFAPLRERLRRGVRFVTWSGHSHGRYADSTAYCDAHFEELASHCVLNLNADCLGGRGASVMTESPAMASTAALARTALFEAAGVTDWRGCRYSRSCDQSFWGPGVPSLFSQVSEQPPFEGVAADAFKRMFGSGRSGGFGYWWHSVEDTPDKLDPALLKRDTQVFASALFHALCDERLPLDVEAELLAFSQYLDEWEAKADGRLDFSAVREKLARLKARTDAAKTMPPVAYNAFARKVLRELIALEYVEGSPFSHDDALRQPPLPMLRGIDAMRAAPDEHTKNCWLVFLRRRLNRLSVGLGRALD